MSGVTAVDGARIAHKSHPPTLGSAGHSAWCIPQPAHLRMSSLTPVWIHSSSLLAQTLLCFWEGPSSSSAVSTCNPQTVIRGETCREEPTTIPAPHTRHSLSHNTITPHFSNCILPLQGSAPSFWTPFLPRSQKSQPTGSATMVPTYPDHSPFNQHCCKVGHGQVWEKMLNAAHLLNCELAGCRLVLLLHALA